MVEVIAFYKSSRCPNGFYTETFENGKYLPAVVKRECDLCGDTHDFTHDKNHLASGHSAVNVLRQWANTNSHEFGVKIKDIE